MLFWFFCNEEEQRTKENRKKQVGKPIKETTQERRTAQNVSCSLLFSSVLFCSRLFSSVICNSLLSSSFLEREREEQNSAMRQTNILTFLWANSWSQRICRRWSSNRSREKGRTWIANVRQCYSQPEKWNGLGLQHARSFYIHIYKYKLSPIRACPLNSCKARWWWW